MKADPQEYLHEWEKVNNPFYPEEMIFDRATVNEFLIDYKEQLSLLQEQKEEKWIFIEITEYAKRHLSSEDIEALETMVGCDVDKTDGDYVAMPDGKTTHIDFLILASSTKQKH